MDYPMAAVRLKAMTGILETGLFDDICGKIIVRTENGTEEHFHNGYADSDFTEKSRALLHAESGTF